MGKQKLPLNSLVDFELSSLHEDNLHQFDRNKNIEDYSDVMQKDEIVNSLAFHYFCQHLCRYSRICYHRLSFH